LFIEYDSGLLLEGWFRVIALACIMICLFYTFVAAQVVMKVEGAGMLRYLGGIR
jgi:hypothetical protein